MHNSKDQKASSQPSESTYLVTSQAVNAGSLDCADIWWQSDALLPEYSHKEAYFFFTMSQNPIYK